MIVWDRNKPWPSDYKGVVQNMPSLVREVMANRKREVQCGDIHVYATGGGVTMSKAAFVALVDCPNEPAKGKVA